MNGLTLLGAFLARKRNKTPASEPVTHDFTHPKWGHNVEVLRASDGGEELSVSGWSTPHPAAGDYLLLANGLRSTRYRAVSVTPARTVQDMWFGELVFAPREAACP